MKSVLSEAIDFFASMECDGDNRFSELCTNIHLGIATWDSKQGQSLEYMVLVAPEALDEWSQYLWKPQRLLTTFSRYYRCVAVPRFHAPDRKHHPNVGGAILTHHMHASFYLSWSSLTSDLRLRLVDEGMYFSLYYHFWKLRQQQTASSHLQCRSVLLQKRSPADPFASSFRGFNLVLLRYLSSISKLDSNLPATKSFVKSALVAHFVMNHRVLGFYVLDKERPWFNNDFFDIVYSFHTRYAATDGYFIDILPSPLQRSTGLLLFSFLVAGLEAKTPSLWAHGRAEFLVLEVIQRVCASLNQPPASSRLHQEILEIRVFLCAPTSPPAPMSFQVVFVPHKVDFNGEELVKGADGANERVDVCVLARCGSTSAIVALAYNSTHFNENTFSGRPGQRYPETRLLWRQAEKCKTLQDLLLDCVRDLSETFFTSQGFFPPKTSESVFVAPKTELVSDASSNSSDYESSAADDEHSVDFS